MATNNAFIRDHAISLITSIVCHGDESQSLYALIDELASAPEADRQRLAEACHSAQSQLEDACIQTALEVGATVRKVTAENWANDPDVN